MSKKNILLIDDEKSNIDIILSLIEQSEYSDKFNIIVANNAQKGYEIITKRDIDLIFLDIYMPEVSGISLAKMLKETDSRFKNIPIVYLTSDSTHETLKEALDVGANGYLCKPIVLEELTEILDTLLGPKRINVAFMNTKSY